MHFPVCRIRGKQTKTILAWDIMWKKLIGFAVLDTNRSARRCEFTAVQYQESVCF